MGRVRLVIAFDASAVSGVTLRRGFGAPRLRAAARAALEPGALRPSAFEANVVRPEAVRAALQEVIRQLDVHAPATLILPAGLGHIALLDPPSGVGAREYARYRLTAALPYAPEEAVVDVVDLGGGRV